MSSPSLAPTNYHYSGQIRNFVIQFQKIFSNWNIQKGVDPNGNPIYMRVPVMYGDSSRQAATIIANNSANNLPSAPMIVSYITGVEYDQKRTQEPTFIRSVNVRQRAYNPDTQTYETTQGQAFTIDKLMPVPYTLRMTVEIWTTNTKQKQEILEQIMPLFNPAFEIQSTDNFIDWGSLSAVFHDGLTYSGKTIPVGSGNPIDVATWKFYMPIWISEPVKVRKFGVIQKIIASIYEGHTVQDMQDDDLLLGTRQKITPYGYKLLLQGNRLQLLPANETFIPPNNSLTPTSSPTTDLYWTSLLNVYGKTIPGISQIWIQHPYNDNCDIVGTITPDPTDDRFLIYNIDPATLPQNTLSPVNSVIDPSITGPNAGLPGPTPGMRYLIVEDIGAPGNSTVAWGDLVAHANDVIEYNVNTGKWEVSFDSQAATTVEFITNITTNLQYQFVDGNWIKAWEGFFSAGDWSIVL